MKYVYNTTKKNKKNVSIMTSKIERKNFNKLMTSFFSHFVDKNLVSLKVVHNIFDESVLGKISTKI